MIRQSVLRYSAWRLPQVTPGLSSARLGLGLCREGRITSRTLIVGSSLSGHAVRAGSADCLALN